MEQAANYSEVCCKPAKVKIWPKRPSRIVVVWWMTKRDPGSHKHDTGHHERKIRLCNAAWSSAGVINPSITQVKKRYNNFL